MVEELKKEGTMNIAVQFMCISLGIGFILIGIGFIFNK